MRTRLFLPLLAVLLAASPAAAKPNPKSLKPGKVHPLTTTKHDRRWSLYVPSKYSKKSSWPVVITSHGRGGEGAKEIRSWQALANKYGFLVAAPDMVTATNHRPAKSKLAPSREDDEVLMEIFAFVCDNFRVNRRAVMVTGFSGGGNPSYHSGLRHPEVFTHICTRGGNFAPQQIPGTDAIAAGNKHLQIYIYFGEHDHVLIIGDQGNNGQAHAARDALKRAGYENVEFEQIEGMKHASRPDIAAAWFGAYIAANKKTFKAGERVKEPDFEIRPCQYLYNERGETFYFMDQESYDQFPLNGEDIAYELGFIKENDEVRALFHDGNCIGIELPTTVILEVTECELAVRGDTANKVTKTAKMETGLEIQVPLFIAQGQKLLVDTRESRYLRRA